MAQKINPVSFRLGISQVWNTSLQIFGKSFKQYFLVLQKYLQIQRILTRILIKNNLVLDHQEWRFYNNRIFLNIWYSHFKNEKRTKTISFRRIIKLVKQWFSVQLIVYFYLKSNSVITPNLLILYTHYLFNQNLSSKKILWNIAKILEVYLNEEKISWFKSGILKTRLKGFKIRLSGRIDSSRNQMARSIEQINGSLSLTSLKNYVEYKNEKICTKSGICGLQIWLFYEFNYHNEKNT